MDEDEYEHIPLSTRLKAVPRAYKMMLPFLVALIGSLVLILAAILLLTK